MTVTDQNRQLVFERRVLRKIYGPTQDNDGAWRIKTSEELENIIKKKNILRFIKSQCRLVVGSTRDQNGDNKNCQKIN